MRAETERGEITPLPLKRRLSGWKEIGAFFGKNERTVKRWELQRGLPVHRPPGSAKTAVFADVLELEEWLKGSRAAEGLAEADENPAATIPVPAPAESPAVSRPARSRLLAVLASAVALAILLVVALFLAVPQTRDFAAALARESGYQPSAKASQLYLSGVYHWNTRTTEGLRQSLDEFHQAIALDPHYAAAFAGLGNAYNLLAQYDVMKPAEAYPLAKEAAEKAIALDPKLADGYSALGFALFYGFKDLRRSDTLFRRALALDAGSSRTFHWYALIMMHTGNFEEPLQAITKAQELDPDSHAVRANRGLILFHAGRADEAIAVLTDLTQSAPAFVAPHYYLATIYLDQQRYADYLAESRKAAELEGNPALQAEIAAASAGYQASGAKGLFAAMLAVQRREQADGREAAFNVARTAALLGDNEAALAALEQSRAAGEPDLLAIRIDRAFSALRGDARFQKLADTVLPLPQ